MSTSVEVSAPSPTHSEVLAWSAVVLALGVVVPGGGLLAAVALFFTRLRGNRTARVALLILGALLAYAFFAIMFSYGGSSGFSVGDPVVEQVVENSGGRQE
jgi:hypothetical protein